MDNVIEFKEVNKYFNKDNGKAPLLGILRNALSGAPPDAFHRSLSDVSFAISKGEKIGLIGGNGAGKTTTLKLIAGLYQPTSGKVYVRGRISFLAGLGIGMLGDLSVADNTVLYGAIHGIEREKLQANLDEIVGWAGLTDFRNSLFKHLSAGMQVRLAFSIYRYFDADIFLMDEALSAGDQSFQQKCHDVLEQQKSSQRAMVIASHNLDFIESYCSKTLWIEQGQLKAFDVSGDVVTAYRSLGKTNQPFPEDSEESACDQ